MKSELTTSWNKKQSHENGIVFNTSVVTIWFQRRHGEQSR